MMAMTPIDESLYEEVQVQITYCKLFPLFLEDFLTRNDAKKMMEPSNLPFTSAVTTNPGQGVQVAVPAGTGSTVTPGTGTGTGQVSPIYNGAFKIPADEILAKQKEIIKNAGGRSTKTMLEKSMGN